MTYPFPVAWHGERLTHETYEKQLRAACSHQPALPDVRRRELDIAIDYRLGRAFPEARREALWVIQQEIDARLVTVGALSSIKELLRGKVPGVSRVQVYYLFKKYGSILDLDEVQMFFFDEAERLAA